MVSVDTVLQDINHGFIAEQSAAFGVGNFSPFVEENRVGFSSIDMQCPGLVRVAEHLHHAGEVMVRQVAAQAGVGLREQLRGLEALQFADDDLSHMGGKSSSANWRATSPDRKST